MSNPTPTALTTTTAVPSQLAFVPLGQLPFRKEDSGMKGLGSLNLHTVLLALGLAVGAYFLYDYVKKCQERKRMAMQHHMAMQQQMMGQGGHGQRHPQEMHQQEMPQQQSYNDMETSMQSMV
jgi:hypothetical protein